MRCRNFNKHSRESASWGGISFPGEAIVGASLVRQVQCCNGGRQLSGFATNVHEIRTARNGHEFCSTAQHGRRRPETHGTAFHVTHRPLSTVAGSQSRCKAVGFTGVTVRPSADSCFWREVPKRAGRYEHQTSVTQQSVYWDNAPWERDKFNVAQLEQLDSRWHHLHQFVSNGRRKRPVTRKDKSHKHKPSTVVFATANVGTLRPGGLTRLNASSRGVTPRCEELSVKFAEVGLHAVMLQETRLQVKGIASTSKYDLYRSPANERGLDGTHVWLDKDAGFSVQASVAQHRRIRIL